MTVQNYEPAQIAFSAADSVPISELICRCLKESNAKDYPPDVIEDLIGAHTPAAIIGKFTGGDFFVVSRSDGKIDGVGIVTMNIGFGYVSTMFVLPEKQGQGIGKSILEFLERATASRGLQACRLNASITAIGFYERCGYREVEKQDRELGGETLLMEKRF